MTASQMKEIMIYLHIILCMQKPLCVHVTSMLVTVSTICRDLHKHAHKILRSQPTTDIDKIFKKKLNKSSHNTCNQTL